MYERISFSFKNEDLLWKDLIYKFDAQDFKRDVFKFTIRTLIDSAIKSLNENFITRSFDVRANGLDINFNWNILNNSWELCMQLCMKAEHESWAKVFRNSVGSIGGHGLDENFSFANLLNFSNALGEYVLWQ